MNMLIDLTKFLIIKQEQFDNLISYLSCDLNITDKEYLITYLFANFFAYFLIIMTIIICMKIYRKLRRNTYNAKFI